MPFVFTKVNVSVTREQELQLKAGLGKAISLVPGKSEEYLLCGFEDNCHLYLRGEGEAPIAFVQANIFGNESHAGYDKFTLAVTRLFCDVLSMAPDHVYLNFADIPDWGVAGVNIDRNLYR